MQCWCLLSLLESKTRVKSSKCRVVFAVIVGEQDTGKAVNVGLCLLSLLESKTQVKSSKCSVGEVKLDKMLGKKKCIL